MTGLENLGINKEGINDIDDDDDDDDDDVKLNNNNCIFSSLGINRKCYALLVTSMKGLNSLVVIQCSLFSSTTFAPKCKVICKRDRKSHARCNSLTKDSHNTENLMPKSLWNCVHCS